MGTYICIADETYPTNTDEEIQAAREALRAHGADFAPEYAGEPDGEGDSYMNVNKLLAAAPTSKR